jgi:phosphatidylserine decarboxylase
MAGLAHYGRREWLGSSLLLGGACAAVGGLAVAVSPWFWVPCGLLAGLWGGVLWFFRDPSRRVPPGAGLTVSPADGRVTDITPVGPEGPLGRPGVQIGIFMSLFDVHVNRSPAAVRVVGVSHRPGRFLDARDPAASQQNECAEVRLCWDETAPGAAVGAEGGEMIVRQIAGRIARRIVTDLAEGARVGRGERIGMIKFGSRVELVVSAELAGRVCVRVGQVVRAGETVVTAPAERSGDARRAD